MPDDHPPIQGPVLWQRSDTTEEFDRCDPASRSHHGSETHRQVTDVSQILVGALTSEHDFQTRFLRTTEDAVLSVDRRRPEGLFLHLNQPLKIADNL